MHKYSFFRGLGRLLVLFSLIAGWLSVAPSVSAAPESSLRRAPAGVPVAAFTSHCTGFQVNNTYNVGPGQTNASIGSVPFKNLTAGDIVRIHYRAQPYREKIAISTSGTSTRPICVVGVPGPNGELPIVDGDGATTTNNMHYDYDGMQQRGLLTIMGEDWGDLPSYINIEGIHFRNAHPDHTFTTAAGQTRTYSSNAAAIHIQRGQHIRISGAIISESGNGLFAATSDAETLTRNLTLEYSYIHSNGTSSDQHHNTYTESIGMLYQFNRFGPPLSTSGGNNIKDRSSGTIIRYNWIEGGAHLIDLVEAEDGYELLSQQADYNTAFVYGNVMLNPVNGYRNMIHFGGDLGGDVNGAGTECGFDAGEDPTECYRKGPLYFYQNTVIFYNNGGDWNGYKTAFRLQTNEQVVSAFNNIFHVIGSGSRVSYMNRRGIANMGKNIMNRGNNILENFYGQEAGAAVNGTANISVLTDPAATGFVDAAAKNFALLASSPAVNAGQALPGGLTAVTSEYVVHQGSRARNTVGVIDYGAYELAGAAPSPGSTIGVYKDGVWYLRYTNAAGAANLQVNFGGDPSDLPVAGDWDGNGTDTIGVMRTSTGVFLLSNTNASPTVAHSPVFGNPGDTPFAGRWASDMTHDGLGVYRPSNGILYQKKQLTTGFSDFFAIFGNPGDQGVGGDWNGDGIDSIGVYRPGVQKWFMTNNGAPGGVTFSDVDFVWNIGTALAVVGDWNGDGTTTVGYYTSAGAFVLHSTNAATGTDTTFNFGPANGKPVAGKWNGSSAPAPLSASGSPVLNGVLVTGNAGSSNPGTNSIGGEDGSAD
jgi:hypothetical protein